MGWFNHQLEKVDRAESFEGEFHDETTNPLKGSHERKGQEIFLTVVAEKGDGHMYIMYVYIYIHIVYICYMYICIYSPHILSIHILYIYIYTCT